MNKLPLLFCLFITATPLVAEELDKEAILAALRAFESDTSDADGKVKKFKMLDYLLNEEFSTDFRIVGPKEFKKLKYGKDKTLYGSLKEFRKIEDDLIEVVHDTGFIGGFTAFLKTESYEIVFIQLHGEG